MVLTFPSMPRRTYGWFESGEVTPAYDPGFEVPCPYCSRQLTWDDHLVLTLQAAGGRRLYFYRVHKSCKGPNLDQAIWDAIRTNGD